MGEGYPSIPKKELGPQPEEEFRSEPSPEDFVPRINKSSRLTL
jgi:hypothetical protein